MGFKSSFITISNPATIPSERTILDTLGLSNFEFTGNTSFDEAMYPRDSSVSIGYYNNSIIICDDYHFSTPLEKAKIIELPLPYELALSGLFPGSEILTTACHSVVNYHTYSLVKNGERIRFKEISSESPLREYGSHLQEEDIVYEHSTMIDANECSGVIMMLKEPTKMKKTR